MHELQFYNPRKRRHSERSLPQQNKCPQHISKKQKRIHPSGSQFPSTFWDNLSTIDLTTRALKELNQRNTRAALNSRRSSSQSRRPITRRLLTELKNSSPPLIPADCYIRHCGTIALKNIKKTAKHGGPDLSDLRGVCGPYTQLFSMLICF